VGADRSNGNEELLSDLAVSESLGNQIKQFLFAPTQARVLQHCRGLETFQVGHDRCCARFVAKDRPVDGEISS